MSLAKYRAKRNFRRTNEPVGEEKPEADQKRQLVYVIQKHRASQLHYDFRLEFNGVLLSWAVPKGPSLDPSVKRLAMQVEDHPLEYATFEGVIPEGGYGAGTVMVWDQGTWTAESEDVAQALKDGDLKFTLFGKKLRGSWVLVRTQSYGSNRAWLLIKHRDRFASRKDVTEDQPRSAASNRLLSDIAKEDGGNVEKAATGDPQKKRRASPRKSLRNKRGVRS